MKKKILQIVYPGFGGAGSVAFSIISGSNKLLKKKIKYTFLFFGNCSICEDYIHKCKKNKISFKFIQKKSFSFLYFFQIFFFLKKENPSLIITHENVFFSSYFYSLFRKIKLLYVSHTPFTFNLKKILKFFIPLFFVSRIILVTKKKDFPMFVSKFVKKINVIENGINVDIFNSNSISSINNNFTIGMACRFVNQKRPDLLIDVFKKYKNIFSKKKIYLSLVGNGPNFQNLFNYVKKNSLENIVKFEGYLNEAQITNWYKSINIFSNISDFETTPTSILQAFAVPVPVIASNIGGHREISENKFKKISCILLTENKIDDIFIKIMYLFNNKKIYKSYKNSAKFFSKKIYSDISMFRNYYSYIK
jgi:glycosyltransferase involved in cell wall biosynthesis